MLFYIGILFECFLEMKTSMPIFTPPPQLCKLNSSKNETTNNKPKVSVIIPVYNVASYLDKCLDSLCGQTLHDIEIICINDCSTDNSLSILREYSKKDERINIVDFKENQGAAVARNAGLKVAQGEFLGFVDPDDYVDLNFYEELYKKAIEDNADIVKCPRERIELDGRHIIGRLHNELKKNKNKYWFTYEWQSAIYKSQLIFNNNIIFPNECRKGQDIVFLLRCVLKANKLSLIDSTFYHYILRDDSLNSYYLSLDKLKSAILGFKLILIEYNNSNLNTESPKKYIEMYNLKLNQFISCSFRNDEYDAKYLCIEALISCFYECKDTKKLKRVFKYKSLLPDIEKGNIQEIIKKLSQYKFLIDFQIALDYNYTFIEKIFSIKNERPSNGEMYKVICIFGIRIKILCKSLDKKNPKPHLLL